MLNAKMRAGMQTMDVLKLTGSLGRHAEPGAGSEAAGAPVREAATEIFSWQDDGGAAVLVTFRHGRCASWVLRRPEEAAE